MPEASNGVAEWFGHRVFPTVEYSPQALEDQRLERCPFLTQATGEDAPCIKPANSRGVCTISSTSNGPRQDWLVCPFRAFSPAMLEEVVEELFGPDELGVRVVAPAPTLRDEAMRTAVRESSEAGGRPVVYFQNRLGGEISIPGTERSPEFSLDITLAEIASVEGALAVIRYGIWEVQTMDFHGSYRYAVSNLQDALRLHRDGFHAALEANQDRVSEHIEGPNKSNVFKRTFYQMAFKFQIATQADCSGCILSVPTAVWDSWQPHLGQPTLHARREGTYEMRASDEHELAADAPACIYVFHPDEERDQTPRPLRIEKKIYTDTESFAHYALMVAPEAAVGQGGAASLIPARIVQRIKQHWPRFGDLGV